MTTVRLVIETDDYDKANQYLQDGWILLNTYVHPTGRLNYALGWNKSGPPPRT